MPFSWKLNSKAPHDFFINLDVDSYFDLEHTPETIPDEGMLKTLNLKEKEILTRIFFNGDTENPIFTIECEEKLTESEKEEANHILTRILGTDLELQPLYEKAKNDPLLQRMFSELYGLKRISRGCFFDDALNRVIIAQISHKPTAKKMVYGVRQTYGTRLENRTGVVCSWPRPERLIGVDPASLKKHGLSLRKGEYVTGLAHEIVSGELDQDELESMAPVQFYNRLLQIRGIGPTTAQDLMLFRNRPDAVFPSRIEKDEEKGLRRWILLSYNADPDHTSEEDFKHIIRHWKGFESMALEYLYVDWIISEKRKKLLAKSESQKV